MKQIRRFIEGLYFNDAKKISKTLKELLDAPCRGENEDYIIVALYEAYKNGKLEPCSETAGIVSELILRTNPHREKLKAIAHCINDPVVSQDPNCLDDVTFEGINIPTEARQRFWESINRVQEVKRLFAQAPHTDAIDERCEPIPLPVDQTVPSLEKWTEDDV